jgi:carbon storage regulator
MLVLTRRIGEEVLIAGNIRVKVVRARGNRASLGITAPACVAVTRPEQLAGHSADRAATPRRRGARTLLPCGRG